MYTGKLVFSQVMEHLPLHIFHQCINRYNGNFKVKEFTCLDQYLCMAFAQLTCRESLRDIEACLRAQKNKLYHIGIRSSVSRNNLANANKVRDWRIYADLAHSLIRISDGKLHEVNTLDIVPMESGAFYIMDRGYLDFARLYTILQVLSVTIFERMPLLQALTEQDYISETDSNNNQLFLFS